MNIIAGIVTYNPNIKELEKNIIAILKNVDRFIVVDNNSNNYEELKELEKKYSKVGLWEYNKRNEGIARGLNQIFEKAICEGSDWVLTLDQDSVVPENLIETYSMYMNKKDVAQIACNIYEKNVKKYIYSKKNRVEYVTRCITSGTLTKVKCWEISGGYDEDLFLDYVDYDFSIRLNKLGYKVLRCNDVSLEHEFGNSKQHKFLFWNVRVSNYSATRKCCIARNIVIYIKRHCGIVESLKEVLRLTRVMLFTVLYEEEKKKKIGEMIRGIIAGIKYKNV